MRLHDGYKDDWNQFWDLRQRSILGRLVSKFRHHFVSKALVGFLLRNTSKGTLVEAGCGQGDVGITIARLRGDRVILFDKSEEALKAARRKALGLCEKVSLIRGDIKNLSEVIRGISGSTVYNIGVVEHFTDCKPVLVKMAKACDYFALVMIPERSVFWKCYIGFSRMFRLVPGGFFVRLYNEAEIISEVEKADLDVLGTRRLRVLGIIPYLGIRFRCKEN